MSIDINQLYEMLGSDDEKVQNKGLEEAAKVKYLSIFILPAEGKFLWENCAKVLASKTDQELEPYLMLIFDWFRDGNWPGFEVVYDRLKKMSAEVIVSAYQFTIENAQEIRKNEAEMWLTYLAGLITNQELLELLPPDQQELMKKYYERWWKFQEE